MACISIVCLYGCDSSKNETCKKGLPEEHYDFLTDIPRQPNFDYLEAIVDFRKFGFYSKKLWLRKPKNLQLFYGSIKEVGLENFISNKEFNEPLFTDHWKETCWKDKSLNQILQNLISSYSDTTGFEKYYIEFWTRRKADNNEVAVYEIFRDINKTYNSKLNFDEERWNQEPKITELLKLEVKLKNSDSSSVKKINIEYFEYLRNIGLHSSASNFIRYAHAVEHGITEKWDKDYLDLINTVETDSVSCENYWNWRQSAEWYTETYDNGP